jgi:aryl-alcohol dehydrogenase (NADP+)
VTSPIVGVTKLEHLTDAVAAIELTLDADEHAELSEGYLPHAIAGHQ